MPSAASPAVEPGPGTNPTGSNRPPDRPQRRRGRPHPPVGRPRPRSCRSQPSRAGSPQPKSDRSCRSGSIRSIRSIRTASTNPQSSSPGAPGSNHPSDPPSLPRPPQRNVLPAARRGRMVLHSAQKYRGPSGACTPPTRTPVRPQPPSFSWTVLGLRARRRSRRALETFGPVPPSGA